MVDSTSTLLPELIVILDDLRYQYGGPGIPPDTPHVFIYFLTIRNTGPHTVQLLGRKWVIEDEAGETIVVEGDKIVGEEPILGPGDSFSYNSFHIASCNAMAQGSFHGVDQDGKRVHCLIPAFKLRIPE